MLCSCRQSTRDVHGRPDPAAEWTYQSSLRHSRVGYWMSSGFRFYNAPKNMSLTMKEAKTASCTLKKTFLVILLLPSPLLRKPCFSPGFHSTTPAHSICSRQRDLSKAPPTRGLVHWRLCLFLESSWQPVPECFSSCFSLPATSQRIHFTSPEFKQRLSSPLLRSSITLHIMLFTSPCIYAPSLSSYHHQRDTSQHQSHCCSCLVPFLSSLLGVSFPSKTITSASSITVS